MNTTKLLSIHTRPEIRKGCVWEIQLKLSPDLVKTENIQQIYLEKPRGLNNKTEHYLCMKVRSKLIKPTRELAFSKVAAVVNEGETIECNESGVATLRVRFTARPRAVFHKHSDMMILIVAVRRGDVTVCTDQKELIFRGGTGSVHSADNRQVVPVKSPKIKREPGELSPESHSEEGLWPSDKLMPEFEDFDSAKFCSDFMQNKGDSLLAFPQTSTDFDLSEIDINNNLTWPEEDFNSSFSEVKFNPSSLNSSESPSISADPPSSALVQESAGSSASSNSLTCTSTTTTMIPAAISSMDKHLSMCTFVYGKRRGACKSCRGECSMYRGVGGTCEECGCYPSRHVDLDKKQSKKRKRDERLDSGEDSDDDVGGGEKRLRYTLETKYFQKLFFNCLHFLSLNELALVCSRAPVPVFAKNSNSVYIYVNSTFCNFILDLTRSDQVLNQSTSQVLGREGSEIMKQDQQLLSEEEGKPKEYDVTIKKQNFRVMKQWSSLRDGQRVIIGAVVSSY